MLKWKKDTLTLTMRMVFLKMGIDAIVLQNRITEPIPYYCDSKLSRATKPTNFMA
jgi:hypothetical protein